MWQPCVDILCISALSLARRCTQVRFEHLRILLHDMGSSSLLRQDVLAYANDGGMQGCVQVCDQFHHAGCAAYIQALVYLGIQVSSISAARQQILCFALSRS